MANTERKREDGRTVISHGQYVEYADVVIYNAHGSNGQRQSESKPQYDLTDAQLMQKLMMPIVRRIQSGRQWFALYRVLVDANYVDKGDYADFDRKIRHIFNGKLPVDFDPHDLAKLEVGSFAKPFSQWSVEEAPVQGLTYQRYWNIGQMACEIFGVEYQDAKG